MIVEFPKIKRLAHIDWIVKNASPTPTKTSKPPLYETKHYTAAAHTFIPIQRISFV